MWLGYTSKEDALWQKKSSTGTQGKPQAGSWLAGIMEQVKNLIDSKAFTEPSGTLDGTQRDILVEGGETILGDMTPTMKALYTLWQQEGERFVEVTLSILNPRNHDKIDVLGPEALETKARTEALRALFWAEVGSVFPQSVKGCGLGVRKGFKVVEVLPPQGGHLVVLELQELRSMLGREN